MENNDRKIHAVNTESGAELVRYDRSGKWWVERYGSRRPLASVQEAAEWVACPDHRKVMKVYDQIGGRAFLAKLRRISNQQPVERTSS